MTNADWRENALCRDENPELFFPVGEAGPAVDAQVRRAKNVCNRCQACADCLAWAVETGQDAGVWGATTARERRKLSRTRARQGAGS